MIETLHAFASGLTGALGAPMLPLLPALLAWAWAARDIGWIAAAGFAASFGLGFAWLNAGSGWLVDNADFGAVLAGAAIAGFGLHAMRALSVPFARTAAPFLGLAFAFGWAPLPGAALARAAEFGAFATAAHGAGLAVFAWLASPILGSVLRDKLLRGFAFARRIEIAAGLALFATGLGIASGLFAEFGFALDEKFPALRRFG
jgi:cytochrome c biogenesis protein CcdA